MIWIYKADKSDTVTYKDLQQKIDNGWSTKKPEPKPKRTRKAKTNDNNEA